MTTAAYLRVSTTKQHLENQKNEIKKFAGQKGLTIQKWHDETISGNIGRKKLEKTAKLTP